MLGNISDGIKGLVSGIVNGFLDGLKSLFVPDPLFFDNILNEFKTEFENKFGLITVISDFLDQLFFFNYDSDELPSFDFTYKGVTVPLINLEPFKAYLPSVNRIITALAWGTFLLRLFRRIPRIIHGG